MTWADNKQAKYERDRKMEKRSEFVELAIDRFIGYSDEDKKQCCAACSKLYRMKGHLRKHVYKEHLANVVLVAEKIKDEKKISDITFAHKWFFQMTNREIKRETETLNEAKDLLKRDGFAYFSERYLREAVTAETRLNFLNEIKGVIEHQGVGIYQIRDELEKMLDEWSIAALENFPQHNSTNEMSNIVERWKFEAKIGMVRSGFIKGFLVEITRACRDLIKMAEKL
jgi:hypothetical protein